VSASIKDLTLKEFTEILMISLIIGKWVMKTKTHYLTYIIAKSHKRKTEDQLSQAKGEKDRFYNHFTRIFRKNLKLV
jgi:hypothetical protein